MINSDVSIIYSAPAVGKYGTIYTGTDGLAAINPDGFLKWSYLSMAGITGTAVIGRDNTVYFASKDYRIYAFTSDGVERWRYNTGRQQSQSGIISPDGILYFSGSGLFAFHTDSAGMTNSSWPCFQHDAQCTGRIGYRAVPACTETGCVMVFLLISSSIFVRHRCISNE